MPAPILPSAAKPPASKPIAPYTAPAAPAKPAQLLTPPLHPASPAEQGTSADSAAKIIDIEFFVREGCPQCDKAKEFLTKLQNLQPQLKIITRDVRKEPAALELLKRLAANQGDLTLDYPAFVVSGHLIIGYSEEVGTPQHILDTLQESHQNSLDAGSCTTGNEPSCGLIPSTPPAKPEQMVINLFGYSMPLQQIGLPLFTLAMGMLDGLNHGSTWVLLLMISLLAPMKNRTFMLAIAGTFITVQGLLYFILLAAWFHLFRQIDIAHIAQIAFAGVSLIAGVVYFRSYMQYGRNLSISLQEITKPGIYTRIRKIIETENIGAALLATIVLAVLVQISEFAYKSIFPALYTHVLTLQKLDGMSNYGYLLLYDFAYILDDLIVLGIGVMTLSENRPESSKGRHLKLISGLALTGLAAYLMLSQPGVN